ncbi:T9SS type A sorting domain-containing protein [Winogradskyella echinorum]|uniref:T9SS type A sorting domain-containing protein n=1 Tax=Winogradskyella echinorum TaxID=538189 RepID=A0ABR6Y2Z7_9FLAO|nr:T9SS type A sorting domain-containing protein [Winogradskyella echinorum]MBC3847122.1 T9SS type A sorting domain-containing protein [Winogradskyella echinorum]MBC5751470.1 T9SS type A sorting domain-containing protein [Winogradskyella echinorum]
MKTKLLLLLFFVSAFSFAQLATDQKEEFTISPNPSKNKLNIKLSSEKDDLKIEVFDVLGKRVYKGEISKLESSINVANWKSGVYLVRVFNDKTTQTKRFIKQ